MKNIYLVCNAGMSTSILVRKMQEAAKKLELIEAAQYRDELLKLEDMMKERWG